MRNTAQSSTCTDSTNHCTLREAVGHCKHYRITMSHGIDTTKLTRKLCYRKDDRAMRAIEVDRELLRRYGHLKYFQHGGGRHLGLFEP